MKRSKKQPTVSEMIDKLLAKRGEAPTPKYNEWVRGSGLDAREEYRSALHAAAADGQREKSGYGAAAERIASLGLTDSGYAKHIDTVAVERLKERVALAGDTALRTAERTGEGYAEALAALEEKRAALYKKVSAQLIKEGFLDQKRGYAYALKEGLSEKDAESVAAEARNAVREKVKKSAIDIIVKRELSAGQAREYGYALGLPTEDVKELMKYAESINERAHPYGYYQYIKDKTEKQER